MAGQPFFERLSSVVEFLQPLVREVFCGLPVGFGRCERVNQRKEVRNMRKSLETIAQNRATRAGVPEQAGALVGEVRRQREALSRGELQPVPALAQRIDVLDRLAEMGQKSLDKV